MTTDELISYAKGFEECIFVCADATMRTKKGVLKKSWANEFWRYDELKFEAFKSSHKLKMPTTGGAIEAGVKLDTPCGQTFCMIFFTKQPKLWLGYAQAVASIKNSVIARLKGRNLALNTGEAIILDTCKIDGYNLIPSI